MEMASETKTRNDRLRTLSRASRASRARREQRQERERERGERRNDDDRMVEGGFPSFTPVCFLPLSPFSPLSPRPLSVRLWVSLERDGDSETDLSLDPVRTRAVESFDESFNQHSILSPRLDPRPSHPPRVHVLVVRLGPRTQLEPWIREVGEYPRQRSRRRTT